MKIKLETLETLFAEEFYTSIKQHICYFFILLLGYFSYLLTTLICEVLLKADRINQLNSIESHELSYFEE